MDLDPVQYPKKSEDPHPYSLTCQINKPSGINEPTRKKKLAKKINEPIIYNLITSLNNTLFFHSLQLKKPEIRGCFDYKIFMKYQNKKAHTNICLCRN